MYKILIVDDERNEREGIRKLLKHFNFDFEMFEAKNGEEALEILTKQSVDVLLTDIKMPHMSGIELIEKTHKNGWDPITIIYSAYGEFEYAQNAISLGVMQYLLKPIRLEEFKSLFDKVVSLCVQRQEQIRQDQEIIQVKENTQKELLNQHLILFLEGNIEWEENIKIDEDVVPLFISNFSNRFSRYWDSYIEVLEVIFSVRTRIISKSDSELLLLVPETIMSSEKKCKALCENVISTSKDKFQSDIFIVVGKSCSSVFEIKEEYSKLLEQLDYQFFVSESMYFLNSEGIFSKKKSDMLSIYFEKIETCAKLQDFEGIQREFEKSFEYVEKTIGFSSVYIKYNFSEIVKKCCEILAVQNQMIDVVEEIYGANSIQEVKEEIYKLLDQITSEQRISDKDNRQVTLTKGIVREQYADNSLSVAYIAEKLNISPAYLSTLFKMDTGINLVKYISQYRIEKAKELLKTSNLKIGDIAQQVGYLNTSYFISLFKTSEGCSPSKYRERVFQHEGK